MSVADRVRAAWGAKALLDPPAQDAQGFMPLAPFFGDAGPSNAGALYPDSSYASSAASGYGRNELVYACIRERAENLPQSTLRVYPAAGGDSLEDHRLRRLLAQPNPVTTEFEFFELSVTYLDIAGNCYWLKQRAVDGSTAELWPLRPDLVRIFPTRNPRVWSYGYVLDPTASARGVVSSIVPIARGDVVHVKYPNPMNAYFGQPPLRPAARAVSLDNAATDFTDTLLRNYAVPGVLVTSSQQVTEEVAAKLKRQWKRSFGGSRKGEPAILDGGMDVKPLGLSMRDLEFPDLRSISESRICAALDVPPILVGAKVGLDRATFTNYGEARKQLWEEAIFSLQRRFGDHVRSQLLPEFSGIGRPRVTLRWDNSEVLALQEAESAKWERVTNAAARGLITVNDGRKALGLDEVPGGDVFLVPAGVVATPAQSLDQAPPAGQAPPQAVPAAASYADLFLASTKDIDPAAANGHHAEAHR